MLRTRARLSQPVVARALKVSRSTVARWETGAARLYAHQLVRLAEVLEAHPCDFFDGDEGVQGRRAQRRANEGSVVDRARDHIVKAVYQDLMELPDELLGRALKRGLVEEEEG